MDSRTYSYAIVKARKDISNPHSILSPAEKFRNKRPSGGSV